MTDDTSHECPAGPCTRRVPFDRLACPTHWRMLPGRLKRAVTLAWHDGNLDAHAKAREDAAAWLSRVRTTR